MPVNLLPLGIFMSVNLIIVICQSPDVLEAQEADTVPVNLLPLGIFMSVKSIP